MRFQGAIFDVDGVLVDSPHEQAWRAALDQLAAGRWAHLAGPAGYAPERFTTAVYQAHLSGRPRDEGARGALRYFGLDDPAGERAREYGELKQAMLLELIERGEFAAYPDGVRLLLRLKDAGVRVAAASSSRNADLFLQRVPLAGYAPAAPGASLLDLFDANVNGRPVARGKPDPAIFLAAAEALSLAPGACLVVEDAPAGVQAARAGGMACLAVARRGDAAELGAAGADWVVDTLDAFADDQF